MGHRRRVAVLVRVLVLRGASAAAFLVLNLGQGDTADANIGAGLVVFAVLVAGGFGWALRDGLHRAGDASSDPTTGRLVLRWLAVAVVTAALVPVVTSLVSVGGVGEGLVPDTLLFLTALVLVPAVAGLGLGRALGGVRRDHAATRQV